MVARRKDAAKPSETRRAPAATPEARENQLISMAYDLVEERMRNGTATSQETSHFLKRGSEREKVEIERLRREVELAEAKIKNMASAERIEQLYEGAINAMRAYAGQEPLQFPDDDRDEYED